MRERQSVTPVIVWVISFSKCLLSPKSDTAHSDEDFGERVRETFERPVHINENVITFHVSMNDFLRLQIVHSTCNLSHKLQLMSGLHNYLFIVKQLRRDETGLTQSRAYRAKTASFRKLSENVNSTC